MPDFVKKTYGHHFEVVSKIFSFLTSGNKKVPNQYMKDQLSLLDKLDGNVDSLSNRISNVRTWAYVSNKSNWVENQDYWIERTKNLEDKLSDRLHEELTKTFIDKRASVLARGLKQDIMFETEIVNIVDFGIFVKVLDEIDGMVHISDLSWDEKECEKIIKNFKKGDKVKVKILDINADKERISLGINSSYSKHLQLQH